MVNIRLVVALTLLSKHALAFSHFKIARPFAVNSFGVSKNLVGAPRRSMHLKYSFKTEESLALIDSKILYQKVIHPPAAWPEEKFLDYLAEYLEHHFRLPANLPIAYESLSFNNEESQCIITWGSPVSPGANHLEVAVAGIISVRKQSTSGQPQKRSVPNTAMVVVRKAANSEASVPSTTQHLFDESERMILEALDRGLEDFVSGRLLMRLEGHQLQSSSTNDVVIDAEILNKNDISGMTYGSSAITKAMQQKRKRSVQKLGAFSRLEDEIHDPYRNQARKNNGLMSVAEELRRLLIKGEKFAETQIEKLDLPMDEYNYPRSMEEELAKLEEAFMNNFSPGPRHAPIFMGPDPEVRLHIVISELWDQPEERFRDIADNHKDLLLSENFIGLVKEKLDEMADRDMDAPWAEEQRDREMELLIQLVLYARFLLEGDQAHGAGLEARNLDIVRSVCKAGTDPRHRTEEEISRAIAAAFVEMRNDIDDMFLEYLENAIAEEGGRLTNEGLMNDPRHNQWFYVLQIVRQGVGAEMSKGKSIMC